MPLLIGAVGLAAGFVARRPDAAASSAFALAHGVLIGLLGSSATFAPLVADTSLWFVRRRGIAVAICASGNYLAGAIWPPIVQHFVETVGWRQTYIGLGVFCAVDDAAAGAADARAGRRRCAAAAAAHARRRHAVACGRSACR